MKIICFSSHTATWFFAFAQAVIASMLQKRGHEVIYITPGNIFPGISNLAQEKILRKEFSLKGYELKTVLTKEDYKQIEFLLKKLTKNNFDNFSIDGIQIGKIAMYEFLLHNKKMNIKLTDAEWNKCGTYFRNVLISFFACRKILKIEKPDDILMFSTLYSIDHVWQKYAKYVGIPIYFMDHGANFSDVDDTLMIGKTNTFYFFDKLKIIFNKIKNKPVPQNELKYVTENFLELLKAKHFLVYSAPKSKEYVDVRKIFNIRDDQKILTATLSSYDETFAAEYVGAWSLPKKLVFKNQIEWIKILISYVNKKKDLFLIIRVHPREFPNKREGLKSAHAKMLEKVFHNLPRNVKINWPTDNISIYDIAQETDMFLNAWSSVGVEMSLLGIPVVIFTKELIFYPPNLGYLAKDSKDYFEKVELALKKGWSYEKIKMTYRWLALYYYHTIVRLRDKKTLTKNSVSKIFFSKTINYFYRLLPFKIRKFMIKIYYMIPGLGVGKRQINDCKRQLTEHVDISSVEKMIKNSGDTLIDVEKILKNKTTEKEEDLFVRHEVKRIYDALYGGLPKGEKVKKSGLRYNLGQVFINK
jgi:hypothetical protein